MAIRIERIQKDFEIINNFNATPEKGITRLTCSEEYQGAIAYVVDELKQIGAKMPSSTVAISIDKLLT